MERKIGCGLSLIFLLIALFIAEWLFLWIVMQCIPENSLLPVTFTVILLIIAGGWVAVYLRIQRRRP